MTEKLKNCPFCGGKAELMTLTYDHNSKVYGVFCLDDIGRGNQHGHFIDNYGSAEEAKAA